MTDDDYMRWLERYAAAAEQHHVPFTLIDTREFKHPPLARTRGRGERNTLFRNTTGPA